MRFFFLSIYLFVCYACNAISPQIDLKNAKTYIHEKFAFAEVRCDPFPHLIIEDILPQEIYEQMQYFWPASSSFSHQSRTNRHLYVTQGCTEWFPLANDQRLFWRIFGEIIGKYIKKEIQNKLMPYLKYKFPWKNPQEIAYWQNEIEFWNSRQDSLMEHHFGYQIPVHVDQAYLLSTALLYCPEDNSHQDLATTMYYSKDPDEKFQVQQDDHIYYLKNLGQEVKIPYKKNTLLVMLCTPNQLHGSVKHNIKGYLRKMYGFFVHIAPEQVNEIFQGSNYKYDMNWMYYDWENRYMKFIP